jgi:Pex14 N-terminal domain
LNKRERETTLLQSYLSSLESVMPESSTWQATTPERNLPQYQTGRNLTPHRLQTRLHLEHARRFLDDVSIKNAPRDRKREFLETKGLTPEQIEQLLTTDSQQQQDNSSVEDMKTVHDSTTSNDYDSLQKQPEQPPPPQSAPTETSRNPTSDVPPIITYPEFLLKPQKPPPLVTVDRLTTAAYALAGLSALTYGASKYLVQPMLEALVDARHDLSITAQDSLSKLNSKLESSVSHVPYIPPLNNTNQSTYPDPDTESIDSDPTELFHRDIATQTSPARSRSSSHSTTNPLQTPTDLQTTRLASLHSSLRSLLFSTTTHFSQDHLSKSLTELQTVIDKLHSSSSEYIDSAYASNYSYQNTSTSKKKQAEQESQAVRVKADIRALKGAFLSSRNFPTARAAVPFTMPAR